MFKTRPNCIFYLFRENQATKETVVFKETVENQVKMVKMVL